MICHEENGVYHAVLTVYGEEITFHNHDVLKVKAEQELFVCFEAFRGPAKRYEETPNRGFPQGTVPRYRCNMNTGIRNSFEHQLKSRLKS